MKIIRISNMAGPTSAPFNTFSMFRAKKYPDENISYICLRPVEDQIFESVRGRFNLFSANNSLIEFVKRILFVRFSERGTGAIVHAHQPGVGALSFFIFRILLFNAPLVYNVHNDRVNFPALKRMLVYVCFC
ncbi:hypothetical protein N9Y03_02535, partial [Luminiphilus sp.]|nr:hypothetical protein [Luminiphilus sp.]